MIFVPDTLYTMNIEHTDDVGVAGSTGVMKPEKSWVAKQWAGLDERFFKPLLTHSYPTLLDTLPNRCMWFARLFTSKEQVMKHPMMEIKERGSTSSDGWVKFRSTFFIYFFTW